ncbi:MAG TPA: hypothetical protein VKI44_22890 [Acetobacteraceae bacterium]|nr:hypothetical protein [Acetobacteraceae bacterium]
MLRAPSELESRLEKNLRELKKARCVHFPGDSDEFARTDPVAVTEMLDWTTSLIDAFHGGDQAGRCGNPCEHGRSKKCSPRLGLPSMDRAVLNQRCASLASL